MLVREKQLENKLRDLQIQQTLLILTTANFFKQKTRLANQKAIAEAKLLTQTEEFTRKMAVLLEECKKLTDGAPDKIATLVADHKKFQQEIKHELTVCNEGMENLLHKEEKQIPAAREQLVNIEKEKTAVSKHYLFSVFYNESRKEFKPSSPEQISEYNQLKNLIVEGEAARLMAHPDVAIKQLGSNILTQFSLLTLRFTRKRVMAKHGLALDALHHAIADEHSPLNILLKRKETELTSKTLIGLRTRKKTGYDRVQSFCKKAIRSHKI